jgi:hypothetical protein
MTGIILAMLVSQTPPPQSTSVSGVVRDAITKAPVAGATVTIRSNRVYRVPTDPDGRFVARDLERHYFYVTASADGYVGTADGTDSSKVADLRRRDSIDGLTIDLHRGARIEGRALGTDEEPIPLAQVELLAARNRYGFSSLFPIRRRNADRDGGFVFENVPPGEYRLLARASESLRLAAKAAAQNVRHGFFPGGGQLRGASIVRVELGGDYRAHDIVLASAKARPVEIRWPPPSVSPPPTISVSRREGSLSYPLATLRRDKPDQRILCCLTPGSYELSVHAPGSSPRLAVAALQVPESGGEESPLAVDFDFTAPLSIPVSFKGDGLDSRAADTDRIAVSIEPYDRVHFASEKPDAVASGGGRRAIPAIFPSKAIVQAFNLPPDLAVSAVRYRGQWSRSGVVDLREGLGEPELEIELTAAGSVEGRCRESGGDPAAGIVAVLPAAIPDIVNPAVVRQFRLEPEGSFAARSIAPGEYRLACVGDSSHGRLLDPGFLAELHRDAARVSVRSGERVAAVELIRLR